MTRVMPLLFLLLITAPRARAQDWTEEAGRLLDAGETGDAIALLETISRQDPGDATAWIWLGDAYTSLGRDWAAQGSSPQAPLTDARMAYQRALAIAPMNRTALQAAYDVCYELGNFEQAAAYALSDMALATLIDGAATPWHLERLARARALAWRTAPPDDLQRYADSLADTAAIVRACGHQAPEASALTVIETELLQQAGLIGRSAERLEEGLRAAPSSGELHQKLVDLSYRQDVADLLVAFEEELAAEHADDAIVCWYRGYAGLLEGDIQQRERRSERAIAHYLDSTDWLARASSLEPGYADGAKRIAVLARSGIAWCHLLRGELDDAREGFLALLRESPEHRDLRDGMQRTYVDGIGRLGAEYESAQDFARGAELARSVLEIEPDNGYWWNNLGYFLREYGSQLAAGGVEVDGDPEAASREVFEQSWQAYLEASARSPEDVRIINDTALIQIYHLQTDLARAEEMLDQAVEMGRRQLESLGEEAAPEERYPVAQALGDAYQNLGYLYYHLRHDPHAARPFFEKALAVDPVAREGIRRTLQTIDEGAPEEPRRAAGPAPAARRPRIFRSGHVAWERDFDLALERARREQRPLFIYQVSDLTLVSPYLQSLVRQQRFARAARKAVCLVADPNRHEPIDRRRDGRRLLSTRYGTVTSGEHTAVASALESWWSAHRADDDPERLEEGFHLFGPDGARLDVPMARDPEAFFTAACDAVGASIPPPDLDQLEASLLGPDPRQARVAARILATYPWARARDRLETLLFDRAGPLEARAALLDALANATDEGAAALFAALVSQRDDPELARLALDRLPAGSDTQAPRFALEWSADRDVRQAALEALVRIDPGPETGRLLVARLVAGHPDDRAAAAIAAAAMARELEGALRIALQREPSAPVRAAIGLSLGHASDAAVAVLERLRDEDPAPSVRAAARRALEER